MRSITSVKNHNEEHNLYDKSSWEDVPYGKIRRQGTIDIQALLWKKRQKGISLR
jgi:hypothetical protein